MDLKRISTGWQAPALLLAALAALYAGALGSGFVNDDYLFLEQAHRSPLLTAVLHPGGLGNFFRPLAREAWFALLLPLTGGHPFLFHIAQFAVFALALVLLADLLSVFTPRRTQHVAPAVLAGVLWFAVLPFQRVNLLWVSCAQDLLALTLALGAFALYRRGRVVPSLLVFAAATLAKESLPLPGVLFLWSWWIEKRSPRRTFARVLPFGLALAPWLVGELLLRQHSLAAARFMFDADHFAAAFAHLAQSLAGVEHAAGWLASWSDARPSVIAFALVAAAALWIPGRTQHPEPPADNGQPTPPASAPCTVRFALSWCALFTLPVWPVTYSWSSYYYTLAAVGGAVLVTRASERVGRWSWIGLAGALLWWHAAGISSPAFAQRADPWSWTSHLTSFYLERAAALSNTMRASLVKTLPRVPTGTRFFFAALPPWAGFQMGNGPSIRHLYRDDSLESHFYSAFSESTAARQPCRFLFWNGLEFEEPYAQSRDPLFQVGSDLLLLDRPVGAGWAFRRGLAAGGERLDHWYWLGWAMLWNERRPLAERAWREWGASDDEPQRIAWLRKAKGSLEDGDTLQARRQLVESIRCGIGKPEGHAMLGFLLRGVNAKYALLETKVAADLNPTDWLARRDLVAGLVAARLDEPATRELARLHSSLPNWRDDSTSVALAATLAARSMPSHGIAVFGARGLR